MKSFYLDPDEWPDGAGQACELDGGEARHLGSVLRAKAGDKVRLFDGAGRDGVFVIEHVTKRTVALRAESLQTHQPRADRPVLALAWTKGLRRSWLLEKAVELEAGAIWFWQATYSQGKAPAEAKDTWRGQLIAGAKQCANPWLPEVRTVPGGAKALVAESTQLDRRFLLHEDPEAGRLLSGGDLRGAGPALFVLGPEGGFTEDETRTLMDGGMVSVSLGDRVLRWETAALLCLGLAFWAGQGGDGAQETA